MAENKDLVLPLSIKARHAISEAEIRFGLAEDDLVLALVKWFASQEPNIQQAILGSGRNGEGDLIQMLSELDLSA